MKKIQKLIWLLCPITLLLGNLISKLNFTKSLHIDKDNLFNTYLVKNGWGWTTLIIWYIMLRYKSFNKRTISHYILITLWWMLFTQGFTSFNIPSIMDLWFVYTGGHCNFDVFQKNGIANISYNGSEYRRLKSLNKIYNLLLSNSIKNNDDYSNSINGISCAIDSDKSNCNIALLKHASNSYLYDFIKSIDPKINHHSTICKIRGGYWIGGHDPSGHIFMLTLLIIFILSEIPYIIKKKKEDNNIDKTKVLLKELKTNFIQLFDIGGLWYIFNDSPKSILQYIYLLIIKPPITLLKKLIKIIILILRITIIEDPLILLFFLVMTWWYSYLITSIVFHTFYEQMTGFLSAYLIIFLIYKYI